MNASVSHPSLIKVYTSVALLSLIACIYAYFKPGISSPIYPDKKMRIALKQIGGESLVSSRSISLNKDTSDRKLSPLFIYNFENGSKILTAIVRVKKRDDFKIETYGLLTKNIEQIYLKNTTFTDVVSPSITGSVGNTQYIQTCIVPKSTKVEESDVRLSNLISIVERLNPRSDTLLAKIMGNKKNIDYSCMVITFKPASGLKVMPSQEWKEIIKHAQEALL
ncbi:MAG: hypothetical protein ACK6AD_05330 [Cyanobacteriota bacterium]|jgi:hypothetical protein